MGRAFIKAKFSGAAVRRLKEIKNNGRDITPALRQIQLDLIRSTNRNFIEQGRRDAESGVWPALSEYTIQRRREGQKKKGKGRAIRILRDTGALYDSIERPAGNALGFNFAQVGTDIPYAPDHQQDGNFGGSKTIEKTVTVPAHKRKIKTKDGTKTVDVAQYTQHQRYKLKARPFFRIQKQDRERATRRVMDHVRRGKGGK